MKKEVYSTEFPLTVENRNGYTITALDNGLLEVQFDSIENGKVSYPFRVPANLLPPDRYDDLALLGELEADALNGAINGSQVFFRGRWYTSENIHFIQAQHEDLFWQRHV